MVSIVMGSKSDKETMLHAKEILDFFGVPNEFKVVSAHRTPEHMYEYAKKAKENNIKVIIAGAGGAAHLPGMIAALTNIPVIGVPVKSSVLSGVDSLLSIVQMPGGVPVATMSIGKSGAKNAGLFATRLLAINDSELYAKLDEYSSNVANDVLKDSENL
ncbi:MAG: 5-(carboxyamino)imidazole ribonucleotide mutase [Lachnospirales bacterium]